MVVEQIHRYPRWLVWLFEFLSALAAGAALLQLGRDLLMLVWNSLGLDTTLLGRVPYLPELVLAISNGTPLPRREQSLGLAGVLLGMHQLLPALGWLALALLLALLLRNSLPTVRTSPRGMLVEFSGSWLPIPWETVRAIKVTEDVAAERFVLLAETDRVAKVLDNIKPARLQEEASSPLFRLVLSPASFFSRRSKTEDASQVAAAAERPSTPPLAGKALLGGTYPRRIQLVFGWVGRLLALALVFCYVVYWLKFLALTFPVLQTQPLFDRLTLRQLPANWWLLVAAHLLLLVMGWLIAGVWNLLPALEARADGLAVRHFGSWQLVPWNAIKAIKVTEFSEQSRVVLIQASRGLASSKRLSSLLYEGRATPGVLVTSALSNFEQVIQRVVLEVARQSEGQPQADKPILQSEARSRMLLLSFRSSSAIDQLVAETRDDPATKQVDTRWLLGVAGTMAWLALPPALLLLFDRAIQQAILPSPTLIVSVIVLFVLGLVEWPLVGIVLTTIDEMTGGGEEGNRALYIYPTSQLPRLLPQVGALVLVLLGVPFLPVLLWLGAIVWSFLLAAAMSEELYDWRGAQLIAGALLPVVLQLLTLLVYLFISR